MQLRCASPVAGCTAALASSISWVGAPSCTGRFAMVLLLLLLLVLLLLLRRVGCG